MAKLNKSSIFELITKEVPGSEFQVPGYLNPERHPDEYQGRNSELRTWNRANSTLHLAPFSL